MTDQKEIDAFELGRRSGWADAAIVATEMASAFRRMSNGPGLPAARKAWYRAAAAAMESFAKAAPSNPDSAAAEVIASLE